MTMNRLRILRLYSSRRRRHRLADLSCFHSNNRRLLDHKLLPRHNLIRTSRSSLLLVLLHLKSQLLNTNLLQLLIKFLVLLINLLLVIPILIPSYLCFLLFFFQPLFLSINILSIHVDHLLFIFELLI